MWVFQLFDSDVFVSWIYFLCMPGKNLRKLCDMNRLLKFSIYMYMRNMFHWNKSRVVCFLYGYSGLNIFVHFKYRHWKNNWKLSNDNFYLYQNYFWWKWKLSAIIFYTLSNSYSDLWWIASYCWLFILENSNNDLQLKS